MSLPASLTLKIVPETIDLSYLINGFIEYRWYATPVLAFSVLLVIVLPTRGLSGLWIRVLLASLFSITAFLAFLASGFVVFDESLGNLLVALKDPQWLPILLGFPALTGLLSCLGFSAGHSLYKTQ